jgi:hypothetical protein
MDGRMCCRRDTESRGLQKLWLCGRAADEFHPRFVQLVSKCQHQQRHQYRVLVARILAQPARASGESFACSSVILNQNRHQLPSKLLSKSRGVGRSMIAPDDAKQRTTSQASWKGWNAFVARRATSDSIDGVLNRLGATLPYWNIHVPQVTPNPKQGLCTIIGERPVLRPSAAGTSIHRLELSADV